ncbi:glycosyltransferase [Tsuneonella sp. HG222]
MTHDPRPDLAILLDQFGTGGVARVAVLVANGLAARGRRVTILVTRDGGPIRELLSPEVEVVTLPSPGALPRGMRLIAAVPALAAWLRKARPRVLHSPGNHTHVAASLAMALMGERGAVRFVPKITNPILKPGMSDRARRRRIGFYRRAFALADKVVVLSPGGVGELAPFGADIAQRARFLPNPYVRTLAAPVVHRRPAGPPIILSAGRLSPQKDQAMLLRALARIADRPWHCRICGTGPEEAALQAQVQALGLAERVEFSGFTSAMEDEYDRASVLALTSRWEGLPAAVIEAIARGCPVAATACSPALVTLFDTIGNLPPVPVGDDAAFAEALTTVLEGKAPAVAPELVADYEIERSIDLHAALFDEVTGG